MSVIQSIREKYARVSVIAIVVALLGFITMDAFSGRSNLFGGNSTTIGSVNGEKIEYADFARKIKAQEDQAQAQGYQMNDATRQQVIESVWNQEVDRAVLAGEFEELGLTVGKKEMNDLLFGANPPQDLKQGFSDPQTGAYNALSAQQYFANLRKSGTPEQKAQMNAYLESLEYQQLVAKYAALLGSSIYYPKWFLEKQNADNSLIARVSYVGVPYTTISDSAVAVSDEEIKTYVNNHKDEFEQKEPTRSISYVSFSAAPTAADTAAALQQIQGLKDQFAATADPASFVAQQGSSIEFLDQYLGASTIQVPNKDSIFALPNGVVYGPYLDGSNYVLARKIDEKVMPDSARVRHILIQTSNPQSGQVMLPDSIAKKRIDSLNLALQNGASFDSLVRQFSDDKGSVEKGGVYEYFPQGQMVKAFNDFVFNGKVGDRDVVKTEYGYHLVEILGQKGSQPHYKIAYLAKPIVASTETDNAANNQASQFAGESRDAKAFDAAYDKNLKGKGFTKLIATDIRPTDYSVSGLGASREFVKAIFEGDKGEVLQPRRVEDAYVVAAVTDVQEAGLMGVAKARTTVEPILRNQKKAAQIKQKIGKVTTLEAVSSALNQPVQTADSLRFNGERNPALGYELKVLGAAFNPANNGKVVPEALEGQAGVYVLRVDNIGTTSVLAGSIEDQRNALQMQARQTMQYRPPTEVLKKSAEIKDNRAKFY
jgi:peptidyl-prolyl cis-trans isomerase D